jgi:hypothetical protein
MGRDVKVNWLTKRFFAPSVGQELTIAAKHGFERPAIFQAMLTSSHLPGAFLA